MKTRFLFLLLAVLPLALFAAGPIYNLDGDDIITEAAMTTANANAIITGGNTNASATWNWARVSKTGSSLADLATRNWSDLQATPTTLATAGITDAYTQTQVDSAISTAIATVTPASLGLVIGTNVQAHADALDTLAAATITSAGFALLADADAAAMRTTLNVYSEGETDSAISTAVGAVTPASLGLVIGTDTQAHSDYLDALNQDVSTTASPTHAALTLTGSPADNDNAILPRAEGDARWALAADTYTKAETDALLGAVEITSGIKAAADWRGIRTDGSGPSLILPVNDLGVQDFVVRCVIKRPAARTCIWSNEDVAVELGVRLWIEATGELTLEMSNGSYFNVYTWTTDGQVNVAVGDYMELVTSIRRSSVAQFFVNGVPLEDSEGAPETIDISAAAAQSLSSGEPWQMFYGNGTHYAGTAIEGLAYYIGQMDASAIAARYADPTSWFDPAAAARVLVDADFASTTAGFVTITNGSLTANQDGIGGLDNWLKVTVSNDNRAQASRAPYVVGTALTDSTINLSFLVYIPSGQGIALNGVTVTATNQANNAPQIRVANPAIPLDTVTLVTAQVTVPPGTSDYQRIYLYPAISQLNTSADYWYTGDGLSHIFIHDWVEAEVGSQHYYDLTVAGPQKPDRITATASAYYQPDSGTADTIPADEWVIWIDGVNSDRWILFDQTTNTLFDPDEWYVSEIYYKNSVGSTAVDIDIGTSASTAEVVSAFDFTGASQGFATLANRFPATGKLHIHANASTGNWQSSSLALKIILKRKAR